ncbi:hypothetical protein VNO77_39190 [Canavalia gladiata]|uniref:Uncharacterized protein n=1 Tax=Canavalia gladiata TaxID=3824 RepID=A0AAN9PZJ2_CANGL
MKMLIRCRFDGPLVVIHHFLIHSEKPVDRLETKQRIYETVFQFASSLQNIGQSRQHLELEVVSSFDTLKMKNSTVIHVTMFPSRSANDRKSVVHFLSSTSVVIQ